MARDHANQRAAQAGEAWVTREERILLRTTLLEGGVMVLLGASALLFPWVASIWLTGVVAMVFLVSGLVTGITTGFRARRLSVPHAFWRFVLATLLVLAGLWMVGQLASGPIAASRQVGNLARVAGLVFVLEGLAASVFSLNHRRIRGWGWGLVNGLGTLALGIVLLSLRLSHLPWMVGILVGMSFLFSGLDLLLFGRRFHEEGIQGQE
ncbi:MAG: hypothetical protein FJ083_00065 [Cyanobacteria bacterium K_Offshore_surface_m2_239]|nr:hypothetical protein [Cyanobacteria bacterium K_Offshore_surface_m2_239]